MNKSEVLNSENKMFEIPLRIIRDDYSATPGDISNKVRSHQTSRISRLLNSYFL